MFRNYIKTALRNLFRHKIYSFINIIGLSFGLASAMLILLYVKDEVSYDRFHDHVNDIYRIAAQDINPDGSKGFKQGNTGYLQGPRFTANIPEIRSFVRVQSGYADVKNRTEVHPQELLYVDTNFFSMFNFPLISGNPKTCLVQANSVVISEEAAKREFGKTDVLGKIMMLKDDTSFQPFVVTGVAKKSPQNSSIKFEVLLPIKVPAADLANSESWFNIFLNTFVVLNPAAKPGEVVKKMQKFYEADAKDAIRTMKEKYGVNSKSSFLLQPYLSMHLDKELPPDNGLSDASNPMFSYILSGIALFILVIACINFVNLTVARSVKRAKEIGIRKVVGGERRQLIAQFLGESFALCLIAFVFAIILVQLVLPVFNDLANKKLSLIYLFDLKLVAAYILLFLLTGLAAGFYPALVLSSYNPVQTLYSRFQLAGKNYLQKGLVVLQFSLASFLIIATLIMFSQFDFLTSMDLGYNDANLVVVKKSELTRDQAALFKDQLMKNKAIEDVSFKNGGFWGTVAKINNDSIMQFAYETVDESYLPLLKIPIVKGRNFSKDFPADSGNAVLVNEQFVKRAGWKNPIGQLVNFWYDNNKKYTVIGVVKDHHFQSLATEIGLQMFTMKPNNKYGRAFIKIKPNTETASLPYIQKVFKELFPLNPYSYVFKDQEDRHNYDAEAKWKQIMLFGAVLTIFISCIGLFGLSVLSAEKRTKEIGIRKVLGASVSHVVTILSKDFLKLVIISLVISVPAAILVAHKWLQNYPYRIALSWMLFAGSGLLVIIIALTTVSFQAIKTAVANPVKSLRTEG
jgi:putative ABC transport system permease protein